MAGQGTFVRKPEVCGYKAVRAAAKDSKRYSSDLLGDTDIRSYRHLPLEADPPRHGHLRMAIQPLFTTEVIAAMTDQFERLAIRLMEDITLRGGGEIGADFALPYVMGCLGVIYGRPQDVDEWISWGPDVWTAEVHALGGTVSAETWRAQRERNYALKTQRSAKTVDDYLERVFDEAELKDNTDPNTMDVYDFMVHMEVAGATLTREELVGMASSILSGGRDTVVKLITGLVWYLIREPHERQFLNEHPDARPAAMTELARYLSPLPKMERVEVEPGCPVGATGEERRVLLSYVSANFDRTVWPDPETVDIHRDVKPNVAFGFGRHSCLGLKITEHETAAFFKAVESHWPDWQFDGEPQIEWQTEGDGDTEVTVVDTFRSVRVKVSGDRR